MDPTAAIADDAPLDLRLSEPELETARDRIVAFVRGVVDDAGASGAVIGLSGGIDSTTTAYLAVEALGADAVRGLLLPSEVSPDDDRTDAERVATDLGIPSDVAEVGPVVGAVRDAAPDVSPPVDGDDRRRTAVGNLRVRARALFNYFVANAENRVVLGTGNRSEALTGYYTKYGDQAVDCNPIGGLYKGQVRQLAAHLGVPDDIVTRTPSARMWPGQTDEGELGLGYDRLDAVLALHVDGPLSTAATVRALDGVTREDVERVDELHAHSEHKRRMPPAPDPMQPVDDGEPDAPEGP